MQHPRVLFRYGILFDGYRDLKWWWQLVIAYAKAVVVFIYYGLNANHGMLFSNLVFTILLLAETIQRPWAVTE